VYKKFQKSWPHSLQNYCVWSKEMSVFYSMQNTVNKLWIFLAYNFCAIQNWGFWYYVRKLSWISIKKKINPKNTYFHSLKDHHVASNLINIYFTFFRKLWKLSSKMKIICYFFLKIPWLPKKQNSLYCSSHKSTLNEPKLPLKTWIYSTREKINNFVEVFLVYL
jgi:hypothetical protein